jgi:hypothetical protein
MIEYSPESRFIPYESAGDRQIAISSERFPEHELLAVTCFNIRGLMDIHPICHRKSSKIPLSIEENSEFTYNNQQGITLRFS